MRTYKKKVPSVVYEHVPCDDCQRNVNAAFDILFEAVLKDYDAPVEKALAPASPQES